MGILFPEMKETRDNLENEKKRVVIPFLWEKLRMQNEEEK